MKHLIFIPTQNNGNALVKLLGNVLESLKDYHVLVVNDYSSDQTQVSLNRINSSQLTVIHNKQKIGYGGVQKIAYQYAIENDFDTVTMLHGDGQYPFEKIPELVSTLMNCRKAALCFGSRMTGDPLGGGMPLLRFLMNKILTKFQNVFLGSNLSEFHSGFRSYKTDFLKQVPLNTLSDNFLFDNQIIVELLKSDFSILEVDIRTHYGDESSSINLWQSTIYVVGILVNTISFKLPRKDRS